MMNQKWDQAIQVQARGFLERLQQLNKTILNALVPIYKRFNVTVVINYHQLGNLQ